MAVLRLGEERKGMQPIYLQLSIHGPADTDPCVGVLSTRDLAEMVVEATNDHPLFSRLVEL